MIQNTNVLVIDDDHDVAEAYQQLLELSDYSPYVITDPQKALTLLPHNWIGVIICDLYMPALNGMQLLAHFQKLDPQLPIIMITGHGDIPMAVEAVKKGAVDFLEKPLEPQKLLALLAHWLPIRTQTVQQRLLTQYTSNSLLMGESPLIKKIRSQVQLAVSHHKDILIEGENGTGRHTLAQILHQQSATPSIFVEINGGVITDKEQLENALMQANGGDLCLYAPEKLPSYLQNWLCHHLLTQDRAQKRQVRLIALVEGTAYHWVESHQLLPELFYLLSQMRFQLPTLRQRTKDIEPLFRHFLTLSCEKLARPIPNIEPTYLDTLQRYHWPNNVIELKSLAELYAIGIVKLAGHNHTKEYEDIVIPLDNLVDGYEKQLIEDALYMYSGRINDAAEHLHIPRKKLYLRMKKHGLDKAAFKGGEDSL
jgi:two-component system phosphoglycerate transport system response regulator PgtA